MTAPTRVVTTSSTISSALATRPGRASTLQTRRSRTAGLITTDVLASVFCTVDFGRPSSLAVSRIDSPNSYSSTSSLCRRQPVTGAAPSHLTNAGSTGRSPYSNQNAAAAQLLTPRTRSPRPVAPARLHPTAHPGGGYARFAVLLGEALAPTQEAAPAS
jgi:hypothetical protein